MSVGAGIFLGCVVLALVYLYVSTRDHWNWKQAGKRTLLFVVSVVSLIALLVLGNLGLEEWRSRPQVVTSLNGIALEEPLSDVMFKHGKFELAKPNPESVRLNPADVDHLNANKRMVISTRDGIVKWVTYVCKIEDSDYTTLNGIQCGSLGDEIHKRFAGRVRTLCLKRAKDGEIPARAYDIVDLHTRYVLDRNRVAQFTIAAELDLKESAGRNWIPCK